MTGVVIFLLLVIAGSLVWIGYSLATWPVKKTGTRLHGKGPLPELPAASNPELPDEEAPFVRTGRVLRIRRGVMRTPPKRRDEEAEG